MAQVHRIGGLNTPDPVLDLVSVHGRGGLITSDPVVNNLSVLLKERLRPNLQC